MQDKQVDELVILIDKTGMFIIKWLECYRRHQVVCTVSPETNNGNRADVIVRGVRFRKCRSLFFTLSVLAYFFTVPKSWFTQRGKHMGFTFDKLPFTNDKLDIYMQQMCFIFPCSHFSFLIAHKKHVESFSLEENIASQCFHRKILLGTHTQYFHGDRWAFLPLCPSSSFACSISTPSSCFFSPTTS